MQKDCIQTRGVVRSHNIPICASIDGKNTYSYLPPLNPPKLSIIFCYYYYYCKSLRGNTPLWCEHRLTLAHTFSSQTIPLTNYQRKQNFPQNYFLPSFLLSHSRLRYIVSSSDLLINCITGFAHASRVPRRIVHFFTKCPGQLTHISPAPALYIFVHY